MWQSINAANYGFRSYGEFMETTAKYLNTTVRDLPAVHPLTEPEGVRTTPIEQHRPLAKVWLAGVLSLLMLLVPALVGASTASAEYATPVPPYCYQADMDDGLSSYTYQGTSDTINTYTYAIHGTDQTGTTSCINDADARVAEGFTTADGCILSGTVALLGAWIPGYGVVQGIRTIVAGCVIYLIGEA